MGTVSTVTNVSAATSAVAIAANNTDASTMDLRIAISSFVALFCHAAYTGGVNRPTPRSHKRRLKTLLAIRCQNSPSNGRSGLGMAVVFWKEVCRQYQYEWRAPKLHRG